LPVLAPSVKRHDVYYRAQSHYAREKEKQREAEQHGEREIEIGRERERGSLVAGQIRGSSPSIDERFSL